MTARSTPSASGGRNAAHREQAELRKEPKPAKPASDLKAVDEAPPSKLSNQAKRALRKAMFDEFRKVPIADLKAAQAELAPYDLPMLEEQRENYLKYLLKEFYVPGSNPPELLPEVKAQLEKSS
jgi:hypothetical protein